MTTIYILLAVAIINMVTFALYGLDKHYARNRLRRIPEATLLLLALIGGSPAAYMARRFFRHKTAKRPFAMRFWLIIGIQVVVVSGYLWYQLAIVR